MEPIRLKRRNVHLLQEIVQCRKHSSLSGRIEIEARSGQHQIQYQIKKFCWKKKTSDVAALWEE